MDEGVLWRGVATESPSFYRSSEAFLEENVSAAWRGGVVNIHPMANHKRQKYDTTTGRMPGDLETSDEQRHFQFRTNR